MKTILRWLRTITVVIIMLTSVNAFAERGQFAVEFDPITTIFGAKNILFYVEPDAIDHFSFSAILFAANFPQWMDELLFYRNADKGFDQRIAFSGSLGTDYWFNPKNEGWHVGMIAFMWNFRVLRNGDETKFTNLELLPRVGYRLFPFKDFGLYADFFAGPQFEFHLFGSNSVDGEEVETTPILPFATMHLGYHF